MDRLEFWPATDTGPNGRNRVTDAIRTSWQLSVHLVFACFEKYAVVAISGLTKLVDEW
jgi:hypothetical protein